ncbi:MAG: thioredoxin [bacterium]
MESSTIDFQKEVIEASKHTPIVVDFWAEWCAPCRILGPVLEKLAREANGTWKLMKLNTEESSQIAMQYGIRSIPAVKMFYNGEVTAEFVGALPETHVRRWLVENVPTESKKILEQAQAALLKGENKRARKLFEQAIEKDSTNFEAKIGLAELIFEEDPDKADNIVNDTPEEHALYKKADAIHTLSDLITNSESRVQKANQYGVSEEPWKLYLKGIQALQKNNYEEALKSWIETLNINKEIDNDGPRKACIALFTWLGQDHELTKKYHRAFTSALF